MVAENYSQSRRDMAKRIGLGRKPRTGGDDAAAAEAPAAPKRRGRKPKDATAE